MVGCLADLDSNTIMFSVNGSIQGTAFEAVNTKKNPLHPAVCVKEGSVELRWGDTASPVQHLPEAFQAVGALSEQHVTEGVWWCEGGGDLMHWSTLSTNGQYNDQCYIIH